VKAGIVASLRRPGGNVTGVNYMAAELSAKRLSLLHELTPRAARIALLVNPANPVPAETTPRTRRRRQERSGETSREIEMAFAALVRDRADALAVGANPLFIDRRVQIVTLATRYLLPTVHFLREFSEIGGLMSYGASDFGRYREVGIYTGRVLKGEKPADIPVEQPTKFDLIINLTTAKALGLTVPESFLLRADEVIE
jgi:putative ABC transport system substrate-binding protein